MKKIFNIFFIIFYFVVTVSSNLSWADFSTDYTVQKHYLSASKQTVEQSPIQSEYYFVSENNRECSLFQSSNKNKDLYLSDLPDFILYSDFYFKQVERVFNSLFLNNKLSSNFEYAINPRAP